MSTVALGALAQPWLGAAAVCPVSVMAMATHYKDTVTTRQASATAHTTPRDLTVSPACLVTMETPGKKMWSVMHLLRDTKYQIQVIMISCLSPRIGTTVRVTGSARVALCFSPLHLLLPCLSLLRLDGEVVQRAKEDFPIVCGSCR